MSLPATYKTVVASENPSEPHTKEFPLSKPGKGQVLVKMEFTPIHASDFMFLRMPNSLIGVEGSGTIAALGEDLKVPHQVGDKVHVLAVEPSGVHLLGTYGEYIAVNAELCSKIQNGLSLEEASCHFYNPATAYYMGILADREGHKAVVQSAATSAMGRMIIKYFKQKGIKTINIVRRDDFTEEMKKDGADYVLNSESPDFEPQLKEIAEKEHAVFAYDAVGGSFPGKLLRNLPFGSKCRIYGALSGQMSLSDVDLMDLVQMEKQVIGLTTSTYLRERHSEGEFHNFVDEVHSFLPSVLKTKIQKIFKFEELQEALEYYKGNSSKGKILLKMS